MKANQLLEAVSVTDEVTRHRVLIATELVDDIAHLDAVLKASKKRVAAAVSASATTLTEIVGIGPICAAIIIGFTGDVGRFENQRPLRHLQRHRPDRSLVRPKRQAPAEPARQPQTSTTPSTSLPSPSSATTPKAAPTTTARSPRANHPKTPSGR